MQPLTVPTEAIKFIAFQRTEALRFPKTIAYRALKRLVPFSVYNLGVSLEAKVAAERIRRFYASDIEREFATIREHLPPACASLLDIGCGVAGIDVLLYRHFHPNAPAIYLLDKTETESRVFYGFKSAGAFYNSLNVAHTLLRTNGVPEALIHCVEATPANTIDIDVRFDLIFSLISWGFHYPVSVYLGRVYELMHDETRLIIDLRKTTEGMELLKEKFSRIEIIMDEPKFERVCAMK